MIFSKILLFPYYVTLKIRHRLYDSGKLKSEAYLTQIISVGNVTVGGTGKTPMVELIIRSLGASRHLAVLSRGYKGSNKGFKMVADTDDALVVGDEPLQIKRKYPKISVAVSPDRGAGVKSLMIQGIQPDVIILDDGFQRRDIIPGKNILLIDYNRPIFSDELLPLGRLRDLPEQIRRADSVVFTKCPGYLSEEEREEACRKAHVTSQKVFFASVSYGKPKAVFSRKGNNRYIYARNVFVFAGIAKPDPMLEQLSRSYAIIGKSIFPDHHRFSRYDVESLWRFAAKHPLSVIMTTEKDAQRLLNNKYVPEQMKERLFYLPIETSFLTPEESDAFVRYLKS